MAGNKAGAEKRRATMIAKAGSLEAYQKEMRRIAGLGGAKGGRGGFAGNPELARIAGAKGGRISRRGAKSNVQPAHQ